MELPISVIFPSERASEITYELMTGISVIVIAEIIPGRVCGITLVKKTLTGIISAITMTLMPVMSSYVISDALSEGNITLIGNSIYLSFANSQWHNGSFTAFLLLVLVLLTMWNTSGRKSEEVRGGLW